MPRRVSVKCPNSRARPRESVAMPACRLRKHFDECLMRHIVAKRRAVTIAFPAGNGGRRRFIRMSCWSRRSPGDHGPASSGVAIRGDGQPVLEQRRNRRGLVVDERGVQQSLRSFDAEVVRQIEDVGGHSDVDRLRLRSDAHVHVAERRRMRGRGKDGCGEQHEDRHGPAGLHRGQPYQSHQSSSMPLAGRGSCSAQSRAKGETNAVSDRSALCDCGNSSDPLVAFLTTGGPFDPVLVRVVFSGDSSMSSRPRAAD